MHEYAKRLLHMLTSRLEQAAADVCFSIPEACGDAMIMWQASYAGGLGAAGPLSGEQRGGAHSQPCPTSSVL